jgi:glycosyltransferase involved in cell wall biosynthesis
LHVRVPPTTIRRLLADPQIASLAAAVSEDPNLHLADLRENPRVGSYWAAGSWALPPWSSHVYFLGPWHRITLDMLRHAVRRDVLSIRAAAGAVWMAVPVGFLRAAFNRIRPVLPFVLPALRGARSIMWSGRRMAARVVICIRPESTDFACRLAGPAGLEGAHLQRAFEHVVAAKVPAEAVRRRIVLVCGSLQPGGAERQVAYTVQGLAGQSVESVHLLCHYLTRAGGHRYDFFLQMVDGSGANVREIHRQSTAVDHKSLPERLRGIAHVLPASLVVDIADLYQEFVRLRPEIVHAWLDWDNVRAGFAAILAGIPKIVLSGRNVNPSHFMLYQHYMDQAYRTLAQVPNVTLINNSRAGADDYADWIGIPRDRIGVVHNAIDLGGRTRAPADAVAALRRSLGIPADAFVMGGVFRLEEEKRPLLWVDTAAAVAKVLPDAWFVVFGQGSMHDRMLRRAKQAGVSNRFVMAGVTDEVPTAMSAMDVMLLASHGEGLPNVLLEAQAVGTPVIATDVGGSREAIDPGVTGWVIASHRPQDLAERIVWLHDRPQARHAVLERGPAFVAEKFGLHRMISSTMRVYGLT